MDAPRSLPNGTTPVAGRASARRFSIAITQGSIWLTAALIFGILLLLLLVNKALPTLVLILLAIILGEAIRPLVARMARHRIPEPVAVLLIYAAGLVISGVLLWLVLTPLLKEMSALSAHLPSYLTKLRHDVSDLQRQLRAQPGLSDAVDSASRTLTATLQQLVPALVAVPFGVLSGLLGLFIDVVIVLTMTLFWLMSTQRLKPFVVGLFPPDQRERASAVIGEIGQSFGGYVRGTLIAMALIGSLTAVGLFVLDVPYALLLGLLAGLTELLPYIGPWISGTMATIVALVAVDPLKALEVVLLFLLIQEIEGNVIEPLVMNRQVHVDPLLVIISVLIGLDLLGVIGAILAVPITAGVQVLVMRVVVPAIRSRYAADESVRRREDAAPATRHMPSQRASSA